MSADHSLPKSLNDLAPAFQGCVTWSAKAILETDIRVVTPFLISDSYPENSSLYCMLPISSEKYHCLLSVGVNEDDLAGIFPGEVDEKLRRDALGEIANVISGLFVADDGFIDRFGRLRASTPFFSEGVYTSRPDWSIRGSIEAAEKELLFNFSVRVQGDGDLDGKRAAEKHGLKFKEGGMPA